MSDPNFASVLDRPVDDIKRPPPYPQGFYLALVDGQAAKRDNVGQNKTTWWDFNLKILQPHQVDESDLAAYNEAVPTGITGKTIRASFAETEAAAWRLKQFLVDHLTLDAAGKTMRQLISEAPGRQVLVEISHRPSEDGTDTYSQVKSTAAV